MSCLAAFLKPLYKEETIDIVVSDRFVDENGEPVPFKLKSLSQEKLQSIAKRCMRERKVNGKTFQELDKVQHLNRCLIESCVQPDFRDRELCVAYGTEDPVDLPQKMLLVKEYERLSRAFIELNGLSDESPEMGEVTKK